MCGDFNVDLLESNDNDAPLKKYFDHIGLKSKLSRVVTTTSYTQIDNVFSNINLNAGTYCAHFLVTIALYGYNFELSNRLSEKW